MDFKLPDKLTFRKKEIINITRLDGKVIDYWEKEFGGFKPVVNNIGEKFYTRQDLELLLRIKQLLIVEKQDKEKVKEIMKNEFRFQPNSNSVSSTWELEKEKLKSIKDQLRDILTILDKNDKR
jgi:DNA-binding transcriptional MerR regulator